jgi:hypothetical protein
MLDLEAGTDRFAGMNASIGRRFRRAPVEADDSRNQLGQLGACHILARSNVDMLVI